MVEFTLTVPKADDLCSKMAPISNLDSLLPASILGKTPALNLGHSRRLSNARHRALPCSQLKGTSRQDCNGFISFSLKDLQKAAKENEIILPAWRHFKSSILLNLSILWEHLTVEDNWRHYALLSRVRREGQQIQRPPRIPISITQGLRASIIPHSEKTPVDIYVAYIQILPTRDPLPK